MTSWGLLPPDAVSESSFYSKSETLYSIPESVGSRSSVKRAEDALLDCHISDITFRRSVDLHNMSHNDSRRELMDNFGCESTNIDKNEISLNYR